MPRRCSVAWCTNGSRKGNGIYRLHAFPKKTRLRDRWIIACGQSIDFDPEKKRVCSAHFLDTDYERDMQAELLGCKPVRRLKKDAVPSVDCVPVGEPSDDYSESSEEEENAPKIVSTPQAFTNEYRASETFTNDCGSSETFSEDCGMSETFTEDCGMSETFTDDYGTSETVTKCQTMLEMPTTPQIFVTPQMSIIPRTITSEALFKSKDCPRITKPGLCAVSICKNGSKRCDKSNANISFYTFPKDPKMKKKWLKACGLSDNIDPVNRRVCSEHFLDTDYARDLEAELMGYETEKLLRKDAVPSIHCFTVDELIDSTVSFDEVENGSCWKPQALPQKSATNISTVKYNWVPQASTTNITSNSEYNQVPEELANIPTYEETKQIAKRTTCHRHPPKVSKDVSTNTDAYKCIGCVKKTAELNNCKDALKPLVNYPRTADTRFNLMQKTLDALNAENRNLKRKLKYALQKASKNS